jgi:hypothetical protein
MPFSMKKYKTCLIGLSILLAGWSCREVYYPDDLDSSQDIPVIQGMILEHEFPVVTLSWALGYREQNQEFISGAVVTVTDNLGNSVDLYETSFGKYTNYTDDFRGVRGRIYTLDVVLPDGTEYASSPVLLPGTPVIDSLYADPDIKTVFIYNDKNDPIPEDRPGLYIMADLSATTDSTLYFRFNTRVVKQMLYTVGIGTPGSYSVFLWEVYALDNFYSVNYTVPQENRQVLREHDIGFLPYWYDATLEGPNSTAPYTVAWDLTFNVYSISRVVYDYYNSIAKQLNASNQIFAPVPSQVKSNVWCTNFPEKDVIGIFEASSKITVYKAFAWKNLEEYKYQNLTSFPDINQGGSVPRFPPYFWIYF